MDNTTIAILIFFSILIFACVILYQLKGTFQRAAEKDPAKTMSGLDIIRIIAFPTILASVIALTLLGTIEKTFLQNTFFLMIGYLLTVSPGIKNDK